MIIDPTPKLNLMVTRVYVDPVHIFIATIIVTTENEGSGTTSFLEGHICWIDKILALGLRIKERVSLVFGFWMNTVSLHFPVTILVCGHPFKIGNCFIIRQIRFFLCHMNRTGAIRYNWRLFLIGLIQIGFLRLVSYFLSLTSLCLYFFWLVRARLSGILLSCFSRFGNKRLARLYHLGDFLGRASCKLHLRGNLMVSLSYHFLRCWAHSCLFHLVRIDRTSQGQTYKTYQGTTIDPSFPTFTHKPIFTNSIIHDSSPSLEQH